MNDSFDRLKLLIGDKMERFSKKTVLVIGLGGVGGYAVESLARLGIGKLILVDGDVIEETNLNRQLIATIPNIGKKKTDTWKKRIAEINPHCEVKLISEFITKDNIALLFEEPVDYVVDACDTVATKKELIRICVNKHIPIVSSMGMGNKLDPTKIELLDIRKTSYDPIAKTIRKMVKDEKIKDKIMTVCSSEQPVKTGSNVISSNAIVPSVAGLLCTSYIFMQIIKGE